MQSLSPNPLRAWQAEAIQAWTLDGRGIVVAATGTGKTRVGIEVARKSLLMGAKVLIVVPTIALLNQWESKIKTAGLVGPKFVGTMGGGGAGFRPEHQLVISVLDSAKERGPNLLELWRNQNSKVAVIFDECHNLKANECHALLTSKVDFSLGLSATPSTTDGGFEELLTFAIGKIIYELPLRRALDEGLIGPLRLLDVYFDLKVAEIHDHQIQSTTIEAHLDRLRQRFPDAPLDSELLQTLQRLARSDPQAQSALNLFEQTRRLVSGSMARLESLDKLVAAGAVGDRRTIFFNDNIERAEAVKQMLIKVGLSVVIDHSKVAPSARREALRRFGSGAVQCLVAVRTVDEGIDVPDAELCVIVGGTFSRRQRVQRIGRVLRPATQALVISLLARRTGEEYLVGAGDEELVGPERLRTCSIESIADGLEWLNGLGAK